MIRELNVLFIFNVVAERFALITSAAFVQIVNLYQRSVLVS